MRITTVLATACTFFSIAFAKNETVLVENSAFNPLYVRKMETNDVLTINFTSSIKQSFIESTWESPCTPKGAGGIFIGAGANGGIWHYTAGEGTRWFYSMDGPGCKNGMLFAINASPGQYKNFVKKAQAT